MPVIEVAGGARLHYEIEGDGPLLLLLHGGTGTGAYDWEHLRVPLARARSHARRRTIVRTVSWFRPAAAASCRSDAPPAAAAAIAASSCSRASRDAFASSSTRARLALMSAS